MKRILTIAAVCLAIGGCTWQARRDVNSFLSGVPPETEFKLHDENGDGQVDTAVVVTDEGEVILSEDGTPKELDGARAQFDNLKSAKEADNILGLEMEAWAGIIGIPMLTVFTRWFSRRKILETLGNTVASVQTYRDTLKPADKAKMNESLAVMSEETRHAVALIKEALKKDEA